MEITLPDCKKKLTLRKPTAGQRNAAAIKAEVLPTKELPSGGISQIRFMIELLPFCIAQHEWGTIPIKQALDNSTSEDYDFAKEKLTELMTPNGDVEKKSEKPSE